MSLYYCRCHGLHGPMAMCAKAGYATIGPLDTPVRPATGEQEPPRPPEMPTFSPDDTSGAASQEGRA